MGKRALQTVKPQVERHNPGLIAIDPVPLTHGSGHVPRRHPARRQVGGKEKRQ